MKKIFIFGLWVCCSFLSAAEVIKISKNKMNMAVSSDMGGTLEVGQKVCVQNKQGKSYCGTVIKVRSEGAICKMNAPVNGVVIGDNVTVESEGSLGGELGEGSGGGLSDEKPSSSGSHLGSSREVKQGMGFGVRGGLVLSNISSSNQANDFSNRKALIAGIVLDLPLGQGGGMSLETGLNFLQQGLEDPSYSFHENSLEVPFWLKFRLMQGDVTPTFFAGPYISYLLSGKIITSTQEVDIKNYYNTIDLGLTAGLGINFKAGPGMEVGLSGSYTLGLSNINNKSVSNLDQTVRHRRLQFLLSLIFRS